MPRKRNTLTKIGLGVGLSMLLALPAGATPGSSNTVTICHVTNSAQNPYVIIDVDVAAFDGHGTQDHAHHVSKDGRVDLPYVDGECVEDVIVN